MAQILDGGCGEGSQLADVSAKTRTARFRSENSPGGGALMLEAIKDRQFLMQCVAQFDVMMDVFTRRPSVA